MAMLSKQRTRLLLALACASLLAGCALDKKYEGVSVSRNGDGKSPYIYSAVGSLDFEGQDPGIKATKVMRAACPQGLPTLMAAQASRTTTGTSNRTLLVALFTCNQPIPGVE
jgi:hypothetical protein